MLLLLLAALLGAGLLLLLWARGGPGRAAGWSHRWRLLLGHSLVLGGLGWAMSQQRRRLENQTKDVWQSQERCLLRLLKEAGDVEPDSNTFREHHPLKPGRLDKDGSRQPTLRPASLPGPWTLLQSCWALDAPLQGTMLYLDILSKAYPDALTPQATAAFSWAPGCPCPATACPLPTLYCTPAGMGGDAVPSRSSALYVQLLFALQERALRVLKAGLASELHDALAILRTNWEGLAQDLASGWLSPQLKLPEGTRYQLDSLLSPNPVRAAELRAECSRGFDGIAQRLWPQLQAVVVGESGSEQLYGDTLREQDCKGIPFYSPFYVAAGALLGVNLWPEESDCRYLLCPGWAFCEFLPAGAHREEPLETVLLGDVWEGQEYELVLSAHPGQYRCCVGEVLKVTGFYHQCPVVEPVRRLSQTLSVRGESIPEEHFCHTLRRAVGMWPGAKLVDYICAESSLLGATSGTSAPHYQVFMELRGLRDLTEGQRYKLDQCLQEDFPIYKSFRFKGSIGPLRLHLVAAGAFAELRGVMGAPAPMARVLRERHLLDFIQSRIIS
ncbi:PREDICTED: GH3 domain-containing protein [Gavialis gangeticus]|uniref:GH3 domain-containing protein n=1 Tax=Gavialis gangeticus TaxID=94835 RepID=UPI00092EC0E3|nr:PREDICTED: GH3 domain-containing protein [Gavialis gangeticus]